MSVCCDYRETVQLVDGTKDKNDSEIDGLQNVQICVALSVTIYARRYGFCTDSTCFAYSILQGIKTGGSGVDVILVYLKLKENQGRTCMPSMLV